MLKFLEKLKNGAKYRLIGNTPLYENITDNAQCWDDPTIQNFSLGGPWELKYTIGNGIVPGFLHVRNQTTLNNGNMCVGDESYVDTTYFLQVATDFYYKYNELDGV